MLSLIGQRPPLQGANFGGGDMTIRQRLGLVWAVVLGMAIAPRAHAQNVDYGALEQMFGQPVTTSATGSPQLASQAPADMQIITADDIRRSGALTIPDVLRFVAGVDVRTYGALDSEVSIGGFSQVYNPRLLVLINGRQVYLDSYGFTAWNTLPVQLSDIRQIEVVQGPASALFGFNAASGVINIITYDPLTDKTDTLNLGIGSDGTYTGSLVATAQEPGKAGVTAQLGGIKTNEYSQHSLPEANNFDQRPYMSSYAIDGRAKPSAHTEVTLEFTHSDSTSDDQSIIYYPTKYAFRFTSYKAGFAADTAWGLFNLLGYINKDQSSLTLPAAGIVASPTVNQVAVVQANDLFKIGTDHAIRIGIEYRANREYDIGTSNSFQGSSDYQDYAISAMWNWQITPTLSLTNAGRLDRFVVHRTAPITPGDPFTQSDYAHAQFTAPSFNTGLVWQPTNDDTFRLLVGRGEQAPSQVELGLDTVYPLGGGIEEVSVGNPYLKPSVTMNYEIGYDRNLAQIDSTLSADIYFSTVQDLLSAATNLPGTFNYPYYQLVAENIGHGQVYGGKIVLKGSNEAGWRWDLSYTLTAVRAHLNVEGPPVTPYDYNNATPVSAIVFGLGYDWNKFEADLQGKWQSRYTDIIAAAGATGVLYEPKAISNFVTLNARIAYSVVPRLILAVTGTQLQAAQTIVSAGPEVDRRVLFTATYNF